MAVMTSADRAAAVFVIGGVGRLSAGLALAALSGGLLASGRYLEFGLAWSLWVPAVALLVVGLGLSRRRVLRRHPGAVEVECGWLFRRGWRLNLAGCEIQLLPTAGLCAVVIHSDGRELALATWLSPARAALLLVWLDAASPTGAWPRRTHQRAAADI